MLENPNFRGTNNCEYADETQKEFLGIQEKINYEQIQK